MSYDFSGVDWQTARYDEKEFTPGDPYEVARLGKRIADTAKLIEEQAGKLNNLVDGNGWDSDAGRAFQDKTRDTVGLLTKTHQRYAAAASALGSTVPYEPIADTVRENWATALNHAQNLVRTALKKAQAADADGSRYQKQIDQHPGPDEHPDKQKLKRQKDAADGELEAAKRDLRRALEYRDTQAGYAAKAIRDALDHDGLKDPAHHWWDNWKDWVAEVGHWAGVAAAALGVLALVLSWVPILGEVLGALALIASVVALVCDTVSALDGKGTWLDVAIDAVGVLSFGAGRILGTTAKEAAVAARGTSALQKLLDLREIGVGREMAAEVAEEVSGLRAGKISEALAKGPNSVLPRMRSVVKESFNFKAYANDIREAGKPTDLDKMLADGAPRLADIADSSFKSMARQAKILYYGSQGAPLLAGWGNLAHTHSGEPWVTGPNFLKGAKELPVIGAGGTPFYNWHWNTDG
ncbi:putative T7SS-secreted protein [Streptomyces sp. NPDC005799]|uniref:putative T7SS-secreted protein n=1 Tax=Streptomyces sp. NPDC005799 TaxID=3154678 RepID=UPI0033FB4CF9